MKNKKHSYPKEIAKFLLRWEWEIIAAAGFLSIILGCYGFSNHFAAYNPELGIFEVLYNAIALLSINTGAQDKPVHWALELGRWLAMAAVFYTAIRGFYLVLIQSRIKYFNLRNHIVIFGHTEIGSSLVDEYLRKGFTLVLVDPDPCVKDKVAIKQRFFHIINTGEIDDILDQCQIHTAQYLFAVTDNDDQNLQIASAAFKRRKFISTIKRHLECFVHIANVNMLRLCRNNPMFFRSYKGVGCKLFNIFENSSRIAFNRYSPDRRINGDEERQYHILIIGCGYIGQNILLQAVRNGHFHNEKKLLVSVIDKQATDIEQKLKVNYPGIDNTADIIFYEADIEKMPPEEIDHRIRKNNPFKTVFVCIDSPEKIIEIAFRLQKSLPDEKMKIVPMLRSNRSVTGHLFSNGKLKQEGIIFEYPGIHVFNMVAEGCSIDNIVKEHLDLFAMAINEAHYRNALEKQKNNEGSTDAKPWHKLSEEFKESSRLVADHFEMKIRAINHVRWKNRVRKYVPGDKLSSNEIEMLAAMEHNRYYAERTIAGWRKGYPKDIDRKIHPYLVKWADLPKEVKTNVTKTFVEFSFKSLPEAQTQIIAQKCESPDTSLPQSTQTIKKRIRKIKPNREEFRKLPSLGLKISVDILEKLPETIRRHLVYEVPAEIQNACKDSDKETMFAFQNSDTEKPSKFDSETKYHAVPFNLNDSESNLIWEKLPEELRSILKNENLNLYLLKKNHPVQMIEMSAIGYQINHEVRIESPDKDQQTKLIKPAGKEGYLVWSQSQKAYYMIIADELGFPTNYMPA